MQYNDRADRGTQPSVTDVTTHRMCNTTRYEGEYVDSLSAVDSTEKLNLM
jgi:hypothetical protein